MADVSSTVPTVVNTSSNVTEDCEGGASGAAAFFNLFLAPLGIQDYLHGSATANFFLYLGVLGLVWGGAFAFRLMRELVASDNEEREFRGQNYMTDVNIRGLKIPVEGMLMILPACLGLVTLGKLEFHDAKTYYEWYISPDFAGAGFSFLWMIFLHMVAKNCPHHMPPYFDRIMVVSLWIIQAMVFADQIYFEETIVSKALQVPYVFWSLMSAIAFLGLLALPDSFHVAILACVAMVSYGLASLTVAGFNVASSVMDSCQRNVFFNWRENAMIVSTITHCQLITAGITFTVIYWALLAHSYWRGGAQFSKVSLEDDGWMVKKPLVDEDNNITDCIEKQPVE